MKQATGKDHRLGHRERMRQRFREYGLESFQDYEALELLLLYVARQQDMKPVAKRLLERFGSFRDVLDAPMEELEDTEGVGPAAATLIHLVRHAATRYLQQVSQTDFSPEDPAVLIDYCRSAMGALQNEQFRLVSLDSGFRLLGEDTIADGTIDQATVYPRKVVETALARRATTLVFVHNHPNGDVTPSDFDKTVTRALNLAARTVGLTVYDHIVVSRDAYYSFREHKLL
jgi:DNA repair protein RadC